MNPQIRDLFRKSEGRYFDEREQSELEAYASGLLARIESLQAIPAFFHDSTSSGVSDRLIRAGVLFWHVPKTRMLSF